jgi:hypothetical protein
MSEKMPSDHTDLMWKTHMQILTKRKMLIEVAETIDKTIWEWYFERGLEVPKWKVQKDPQWWIDYLASLDENK